jgi:adenosylmethionine-8-amino-7-oxononanoate aminotransferase
LSHPNYTPLSAFGFEYNEHSGFDYHSRFTTSGGQAYNGSPAACATCHETVNLLKDFHLVIVKRGEMDRAGDFFLGLSP